MGLGDAIGLRDDAFDDVEMITAGLAPLPTQFFRLDGDFFGTRAPGNLLQPILALHVHAGGDTFNFLMPLAELVTQDRWKVLDMEANLPCFLDFVTGLRHPFCQFVVADLPAK